MPDEQMCFYARGFARDLTTLAAKRPYAADALNAAATVIWRAVSALEEPPRKRSGVRSPRSIRRTLRREAARDFQA